MTIVHCTTVHVRTDTRIFRKECRSIATRFSDVYLVVGDGKGDWDDPLTGLHVCDIGAIPWGNRLGRILLQPFRAWRCLRKLQPDLVHVHDPELLFIAFFLCLTGVRVIYDIHEDLPKQIMTKHWVWPWMRWALAQLARLVEDFICSRMTALVVATPAIGERFKNVNSLTITVNNFPIADELDCVETSDAVRDHICYIGGITRIRGISVVLDALLLVPGLRLKLCGPFESDQYMRELRRHRGWKQVDYLGIVDRDQMRLVLNGSFAGLVTFLPAPNHVDAQPQKVFEYMSAGVPVIGSNFDLWRMVIGDAGAGLCVDPTDPKSIAQACRELMSDPIRVAEMGSCGKKLVAGKLNWTCEFSKLENLYADLGVVHV
jgi:glycosyltransferase involved in cell wall biosynthesis